MKTLQTIQMQLSVLSIGQHFVYNTLIDRLMKK